MEERRSRKGWKIILAVLIIAIVGGAFWLFSWLNSPKDVKLNPGWQQIQLEGIVPSGAVVIVDQDSNAVFPSKNPETKQKNAFVSQGRINFLDGGWIITENKVWVYYPAEYEFILDKGEFNQECLDKLSDLTGNTETSCKEFDFGKP